MIPKLGNRSSLLIGTAVVVLMAWGVGIIPAPRVAHAGHGGARLDVAGETRDRISGDEAKVVAFLGSDATARATVNFEWQSGPGDTDSGASYETPDRTCRIQERDDRCTVRYGTYGRGKDVIRVWITGHPLDRNERRNEAEKDDTTDVITRTWMAECEFHQPTIEGTEDDDTIQGTSGNDVIAGLEGDDVIRGLSGDDVLCGNEGNDELRAQSGRDRVAGGLGRDKVTAPPCNDAATEADYISGNGGSDRVLVRKSARDCPHEFVPGRGQDVVNAGVPRDNRNVKMVQVLYTFLRKPVRVDLSRDSVIAQGRDRLRGVAIVGGLGGDTMLGNSDRNDLDGGSGNDVIKGSGGPDFLQGGGGRDNVDGQAGSDLILGFSGDDRILGGPANDVIWGHGDDDRLFGGQGDDVLKGGHDHWGKGTLRDRLAGGDGSDVLYGFAGDDRLFGNDGNDVLFGFLRCDGCDFGRVDRDLLIGGDGDDRLEGGPENDELYGGRKDDGLDGGAARDLCRGGRGRDKRSACER